MSPLQVRPPKPIFCKKVRVYNDWCKREHLRLSTRPLAGQNPRGHRAPFLELVLDLAQGPSPGRGRRSGLQAGRGRLYLGPAQPVPAGLYLLAGGLYQLGASAQPPALLGRPALLKGATGLGPGPRWGTFLARLVGLKFGVWPGSGPGPAGTA